MSADYRPRGGGDSSGRSNSGAGGGRRRRGGRGRSQHGEPRPHTNGHTSSTPKKEESTLSKLFGWLTGKKPKAEASKPAFRSPTPSRTDFTKERTPRAERTDRAERTERTERPPREDRPPKADPIPQEIVSPKLYVGNLAYEAAESDLFDLFSKVGAVKNVEVAMDRRSGRSKGFGFVEMESLDSAKAAAEKLNRTDFMARQIVVSGAKVDKRPIQSSREEAPDAAPQEPHEHQPETGSSNPDATA